MPTSLPTYTGDTTSLVQPTGTQLFDALIVGSKWGTGAAGTAASVTYSFPASMDRFDSRASVAGNYSDADMAKVLQSFSAFDEPAKVAVREVLAAWASVANLTFTEVAANGIDDGVLRFGYSAPPGMGASTYAQSAFPQDNANAGDTWMNRGFMFPEGWALGTQNFLTMLHEVGHAIGLKHPHDTGMSGSPGWPNTPAVFDKTGTDTLVKYSTQQMVMAYNDIPNVGGQLQADFAPTTPMPLDIAAIQYLYGPNLGFNAGDTVYNFDTANRYNQTIWDGGGNDTIRISGSASTTIDLTPGSWSKIGPALTFSDRNPDLTLKQARPELTDPETLYIYGTVVIENAIGGDGNDIITGNAANNTLTGGGGNDTINGGAGADTAAYSGARAGYTFTSGSASITVSGGTEGTDTLSNVERLRFSDMRLGLDTAIGQTSGNAALLLGAVLGGAALASKQAVLGAVVDLMDQGLSLQVLSGAVMRLPVWGLLANAGNATADNNQIATYLLTTVNKVAPDAGTLATAVAALDAQKDQASGQGDFLWKLAESGANQVQVNLVGLASTGIDLGPPLV